MTRHYIQGYKHQVISLMIHYMEKNLWYSWREEHSWIEDLSEPDFKRAFDKMELYCDLLIFYGEYDMFDDRSHIELTIYGSQVPQA